MRPHQLLPIKNPREYDPGPKFFYENVAKPLIPTFIRVMSAGISLDQEAVENLRSVVEDVVIDVQNRLDNNPIIRKFQEYQYPTKFAKYKEEVTASCRTTDYYLKPYDGTKIPHRTALVNHRLRQLGLQDEQRDKWTVSDLKKANMYWQDRFLDDVIDSAVTDSQTIDAMTELAEEKVRLWNKVRYDKVEAVAFEELVPKFKANSSKQKQELFSYLGIQPLAFSKDTGEASWGRDQIEELFNMTEDEDLKEILQAFIDHSFSNIIKTNFMESFDKFTIDDILYGNIKNFGAKSYRPTSNAPNLNDRMQYIQNTYYLMRINKR